MGRTDAVAHDPSVAEIPRYARDRPRHLPVLRAGRNSKCVHPVNETGARRRAPADRPRHEPYFIAHFSK